MFSQTPTRGEGASSLATKAQCIGSAPCNKTTSLKNQNLTALGLDHLAKFRQPRHKLGLERQVTILRRYIPDIRFDPRNVFGRQLHHFIAALIPEPRQRLCAKGIGAVIPHPPIPMSLGNMKLPMKRAQCNDLLRLGDEQARVLAKRRGPMGRIVSSFESSKITSLLFAVIRQICVKCSGS